MRRAYHPGCALRFLPVIVGPQECGKSVTLRKLVPIERYHGDSISWRAGDQKLVENTLGKVLAVLPEMEGRTESSVERIKEMITRTVDTVRLSYRRNAADYERRFVLLACCNMNQRLPNDVSGNTRFVVVHLPDDSPTGRLQGNIIESYFDANRDQIWAEALAIHRAGHSLDLPDALRPLQRSTNEAMRARLSSLEEQLSIRLTDEGPGWDSVLDIKLWLAKDEYPGINALKDSSISAAMTAVGYERTVREGKISYRRPAAATSKKPAAPPAAPPADDIPF